MALPGVVLVAVVLVAVFVPAPAALHRTITRVFFQPRETILVVTVNKPMGLCNQLLDLSVALLVACRDNRALAFPTVSLDMVSQASGPLENIIDLEATNLALNCTQLVPWHALAADPRRRLAIDADVLREDPQLPAAFDSLPVARDVHLPQLVLARYLREAAHRAQGAQSLLPELGCCRAI